MDKVQWTFSPPNGFARGEVETDKGPVDLGPTERVRQGWWTLVFPAAQDSAAEKGPWTGKRSGIAKRHLGAPQRCSGGKDIAVAMA